MDSPDDDDDDDDEAGQRQQSSRGLYISLFVPVLFLSLSAQLALHKVSRLPSGSIVSRRREFTAIAPATFVLIKTDTFIDTLAS